MLFYRPKRFSGTPTEILRRIGTYLASNAFTYIMCTVFFFLTAAVTTPLTTPQTFGTRLRAMEIGLDGIRSYVARLLPQPGCSDPISHQDPTEGVILRLFRQHMRYYLAADQGPAARCTTNTPGGLSWNGEPRIRG
jgi:hypothetical protein